MAKHAPKPINIERLIMWIEANIGLTKMKAKEYINIAAFGLDMVYDREGKNLLFEPEKPM